MNTLLYTSLLTAMTCGAATSVAAAQWTANSAVNTPVCVQPNDQAVPKAAAAGGGRTWIGWFDHRGSNYDVYVQLLDRDGNGLLGANGLLVSSNTQNTSLVGWDLISDSGGNCVLAFTDIRAGGDLDVYAYRISPTGVFLWGGNGVTLSNNADFEANPSLAELSDGSFICVWSLSPNTGTGSIRAQRIDTTGAPLLGPSDIALPTGTTTNEKPGFCTVVTDGVGGFIVQWLRNTATFSSPRHIRVQRYGSNALAQWNAGNPVVVLDATSVPIAHQPTLKSDGAAGALLAWHRSATFSDCYVQHVDASGTELFAHNGLQVSLEANRHKFDPALAYLPASGDMVVLFDRRDSGQGNRGVGVQRISAAGVRLWGSDGIELAPVDSINEGFERIVPFGDGVLACYFQYPTFGNLNSNILATRLDGNGSAIWNSAPIAVCSNLVWKDKPQLVIDATGDARLVWDDERADSGDIYAQNLHYDGTLGIPTTSTGALYCLTSPNSVGPGAALGWTGSTSLALNNFGLEVNGAVPGQSGIFFYGATQTAPVPFKNGWMCMASPLVRLSLQTIDIYGATSRTLDLFNLPAGGAISAGSAWNFQFWYRDPAGSPATTNTSDALNASFAP